MKFITVVDPRKNSVIPIGGSGTAELVWKAIRTFDTRPEENLLDTARRVHEVFKSLRNERPDPPLSLTQLRKIIPGIHLRFNNAGEIMPRIDTPENFELVDLLAPNEYGDERGNTLVPNSINDAFSAIRSSITSFTFNGKLKVVVTLRGDLDGNTLNEFEKKLKLCEK